MSVRLRIRRLGIVFVILLGMLITLRARARASSASDLTFGAVIRDAIGTVAEEDSYTFAADAGDIILVRMSKISGTLKPHVGIVDEGGTELCADYDYYNTAEIAACTMPSTGAYSVRATDHNLVNTGTYGLYIQRLNAPGNTTSFAYGSTQSGSLTSAALLNTLTIGGNTGDHLVVQATTTSGTVSPKIRVYDPTGTLLCQNSSTYSPVFIDTCTLLTDGPHTLLVGDNLGTHVGVYNLHVQRLNNPVGGDALPDAQTRSETVAAAAELDAYTFTGNVGDVLVIRAAPTSAGGLDPQLRVYGPNGTQICTDYSYDNIADIPGCTLVTQGTQTLLVSDHGGSDVGNYDLYLVRPTNPVGASPLAYGETKVKATSHAAQLDAYTFEGKTGEVLVGQVGVPDHSFDPELRVYSGTGTLICQDYAYTQYVTDAPYVHCILPSDQTYVAFVGTYPSSSRMTYGTYDLHLQRVDPAPSGVPLQFGVPIQATISPAGEWDAYTFRAASGDVVTARMTCAVNVIDPHIRLYGTDGVKLCEAYGSSSSYMSGKAEFVGCTLPFSGTYTLLAGTHGADKIGAYNLSLSCDGASCGFPLVFNEHVYLPLVVR